MAQVRNENGKTTFSQTTHCKFCNGVRSIIQQAIDMARINCTADGTEESREQTQAATGAPAPVVKPNPVSEVPTPEPDDVDTESDYAEDSD